MKRGQSGFFGVDAPAAPGRRYRVRIGRERTYLGSYPTAEEAAKRYDEAALARFGPTAILNFSKDKTN